MRRLSRPTLIVLLAGCLFWGCSNKRSDPPITTPGANLSISGTIRYDFVPTLTTGGLDHANTTQRPVRNATVQLLDASTNGVLTTTTTNATGNYTFSYTGPALIAIRILAQTTLPGRIEVQDNTSGGALYAVQSTTVDASVNATFDFAAGSGFDLGTQAYTGGRAAAPFAILDTIQTTAEAFSAVASLTFPDLVVNWSTNNVPQSGNTAQGRIGTTFYDSGTGQIFVLGDANVDTDEFDRHVLAHEWGHYYEHRFARLDSIGGRHSGSDVLDPRVAMSEGFCNALSAMILFPDTTYKDTTGQGQGVTGISFDLETGTATPSPGWFSEASVGQILYDLQDAAADAADGDNVGVGLGGIHNVMVDSRYRSAPELTTLFSFVATAKARFSSQAAQIDALTTSESIQPVADNQGTGETNNGGLAANLPVYRTALIGGGNTVLNMRGSQDTPGVARDNLLQQNRYLRFTGNGGSITIMSACTSDVDLLLYQNGAQAANATGTTGNETINFTTTNGAIYVLAVQGKNPVQNNDYTCTITIN